MSIFIPNALAQVATSAQQKAEPAISGITDLVSKIFVSIPLWIAAFVILILTLILANVAKESAKRALIKTRGDEIHEGSVILVGRVTYVAILSIGLVISLQIAGMDLGWLLGAIGLGAGFSMKDIIRNFISGVIILLENEINIGDFISVNETKGTIVNILPRATIIQALDGTKITIPNGTILSSELTCFTANPTRRISIQVGVSFDTDLDKAQEVLLELVKKHPIVIPKPKPSVVTKKFGDSAILLEVHYWVNSHDSWLKSKSELIRDIKKTLDENGINIPFPIHTVYGEEDHPIPFGKAEPHHEASPAPEPKTP